MPWIALTTDGRRVTPEQVDDGVAVTCPDCDEEMYPRGPTTDGKARHFVHTARSACRRDGGGIGESETHRRMKSQAISAVTQWFGSQIQQVEPEMVIDTSMTASPVATRQADVGVIFNPPHPIIGDSLAVEVQYKNHNKPVEAVTHDYVVAGYSVYWALPDDFTDDRFLVDNLVGGFHRAETPAVDVDASGSAADVPTAVVAETASPLRFDPATESDTSASAEGEAGREDESASTSVDTSSSSEDEDGIVVTRGDGETKTIPTTVPERYLYVDDYQNYDDVPDVFLRYPDEECLIPYATLETHPPAEMDASVPRTTSDGHPIPQLPDCDHSYPHPSMIEREYRSVDSGVPCENCGEPLYRASKKEAHMRKEDHEEGLYYYVARPYRSIPTPRMCFVDGVEPDSSGDTQLPYCGDRIWRVDFETDEYQCTTCGRRFPRQNEKLRAAYGD